MNIHLRKLLGPYCDEASDGTDGAAASAAEEGDGQSLAAGDEAAQDAQKTPAPPIEEGMADMIMKGLEKTETPKKPEAKNDKAGEPQDKAAPKVGDAKPEARQAKETAKTDAELKPKESKKSTDFQLSPEEKKAVHPKTQQRFHELVSTLKERETEISTVAAENKALREARDGIMTVLDEHQTTSDDLAQLLAYNKAVKSGDFNSALQLLEAQRAIIYKSMGKEAPGVDLLSEFPDLVEKVEAMEMKRESAIEIANARRLAQSNDQRGQVQRQNQEREAQAKRQTDEALAKIGEWDKGLKGADIDYAKKLAKLSPQIEGVLNEYPPHLWLPTLKRIYDGITVVKPAVSQQAPLRPTGARAGSPAPASMEQAISQGLGLQH